MPAKSPKKRVGSRAQVMHGTAHHTSGGLLKKSLKKNKWGRIVSRKKSRSAKKKNLLKDYKHMRFTKRKSPRRSKRKSKRKSRRRSPRKSCRRGQIRDRRSKRCRRKKCYPKVRDRRSKRCRSPKRRRSRRRSPK
jgi:hypothetical protein